MNELIYRIEDRLDELIELESMICDNKRDYIKGQIVAYGAVLKTLKEQ